jgi:Flp pilus assembly protein TadG
MKLHRQSGNSMIEFTLLMPWMVFLFIGAMDWGFYAYALIATEAAARVACTYTSSSAATATDTNTACTYAVEQLKKMPNVTGMSDTGCATGTGVSNTTPVGISATAVTGPDTNPAAQVSVTYLTPVLIPGPSGTPKQLTITRTIQMRLRG